MEVLDFKFIDDFLILLEMRKLSIYKFVDKIV